MHKQLFNAIADRAQRAVDRQATSRSGVVTSYNPSTYSVKVQLQPDGMETGWLPLLSQQVGNGFGLYSPPNAGDLVHVVFTDGDIDGGVVVGAYYNDEERPLSVPSGEVWLVHVSGAFIKLNNDGQVLVQDQSGSVVQMKGDGTGYMKFAGGLTIEANTKIIGNLDVTENIQDVDGAHGTLADFRSTYNGHDHPGVKAGSDKTAPPEQQQ